MSRSETSHRTVFSRSSYLNVLIKYIQNSPAILILMELKYSIEVTVVSFEAAVCRCSSK